MLEISESTGESMESLYDRISKGTLSVEELTNSMRRATSEGGKFFGSMEAQSQTVSGLLSSLKDELSTLGGEIFEPLSEALRTKVLPEAIRIVQEMQDAYSKGGFDGLVDALTAEIPKLLNAASAALEKLAGKLKAKLPGIIKKLISALPEVLASLGDSILPTLVDTIFEIISVAVEEIVGRLPELVPIILRGVWNLIKSIASGILNVATGLFDGIETALKKLGLLSLTPMEAFEQAWENADTSQIKDIDVQVGVNMTAEEYETEIETAIDGVRNALLNVPGLTEAERLEIESAIINGTGIDLLGETLSGMGIDQTKVDGITEAMKTAKDTIETTLKTDLKLSDEAVANITALAASGGDVKKALEEDYGIDSTTAAAAAETITTAMGSIDTAVAGIGLDDTTIKSMKLGVVQDKVVIETVLRSLGMDQTVIDEVLGSYDTLSGSVTAQLKNIYSQIAEEFTNGVPESDETVKEAEAKVKGVYSEAQERLDKWYKDAMEDLETKGLSGAALESERTRITNTYNEISSGLETTTTTMLELTEDMVGKSQKYCEGQIELISGYVDQLDDFTAKVDVLTNEQYSTSRTRRRLVQEGVVTNEQHQYEAMALTAEELTERLQNADTAAAAAYEEAAKNLGENSEAYKAKAEEIAAEYAQAQGIAYDIYNAEMTKIITGIAKSNPELAAALEQFGINQEVKSMIETMHAELTEAAQNAEIDADDFWNAIEVKGVDTALVAEKLGMDETSMKEILSNAVNTDNIEGTVDFVYAATQFTKRMNSDINDALADQNIDASSFLAPFKKAIESESLKAVGDIDWTNHTTILNTALGGVMANASATITAEEGTITTAIDTTVSGAADAVDASDDGKVIGNELGNGIAAGIKEKRASVLLQSRLLAQAAVNEFKTVLGIASPSKVTKQIGAFFGEGFALGIEGQVASANRAAAKMAESAIGTIDGIGANMSINSQINTGSMASAFQNMLSAMNIATDKDQPVQLFINGRLVAETIKRDIAATQAGYNMDLAKGVGKA